MKPRALSLLGCDVKDGLNVTAAGFNLWLVILSKADFDDVYFSIPDVHYLYKWLVIRRVQPRDKMHAQSRVGWNSPENVLSSFLAFFLCPAKEK